MLVTKKIERMFIVQMTEEQKDNVLKFLVDFDSFNTKDKVKHYSSDGIEAANDLRLSLLNA